MTVEFAGRTGVASGMETGASVRIYGRGCDVCWRICGGDMSTLTLDHLRDVMATLEAGRIAMNEAMLLPPEMMQEVRTHTATEINLMSQYAATYGFAGMRVFESPLARLPARTHKRRRWMSTRYHNRIQKKWNKRFGYKPAAFVMNMDAMTFSPRDMYR